jgi:hypothetical protein
MGGFRRIVSGGALVVLTLGFAVAAPGGSASATQPVTVQFTGTCHITIQPDPSGPTPTTDAGQGSCTGSLTGYIGPDQSGTESGTFPSYFEIAAEQGTWVPPAGGAGATPVLVSGPGVLDIEADCGGGGFCSNGVSFGFTQVTPLALAAIGTGGGVGAGLVIPGGSGTESVTFVAVALK